MRLFIALEPSHDFRIALGELQTRLKAVGVTGRYLDISNLHLTFAYIGEWPEAVTELLPIVEDPFEITLSHLGIFTNAKVLWAGIQHSEKLEALAGCVREKLDRKGIPYDHQRFNPHITLVRKPILPGEDVLSSVRLHSASMVVHGVALYQSIHEQDGVQYTVIGRSEKVKQEELFA